MIIFLTRKDAGRRGATALEPGDLLEAIINEDQGELAKRFVGATSSSAPIRAPEPFFASEVAANTLVRLQNILPQQEPIADSVDMQVSPRLQHILNAATTLAGELNHTQVQPLHFVAAILTEENSGPAEILREAGISKDAVIQALGSESE
jgi:ATP-dependent Clp protease ATP-binding subunit ClpA